MIVIKDMEMPNCCYECFFYDESDGFCRILDMSKWDEYIKEINHSDYDWKYEKRANICPLVEIGTCKDCVKGHKYKNVDECFCDYLQDDVDNDFYCADFEKRGNENGSN